MNAKITKWDNLPVVIDLHTVCLIFGAQEGTVKRWIYNGDLKAFKIGNGRKWFFNRDYIRSICEGNVNTDSVYIEKKRELEKMNLPPAEYERKLQALAQELGM